MMFDASVRLSLTAFLIVTTISAAAAEPISASQIEIVDGDTIRVGGEKVRLVGFDTPETGAEAGCDIEIQRGNLAARRLEQLLISGQLDIRYRKHRDKYGRRLATLKVDGVNIGRALIREQLAVPYKGSGYKMNWCPRGPVRLFSS